METTAISWCDSTFNPWLGCTKVSPACDHCYAERLMDHRMHKAQWGAGQPRVRTSAANWRQPLRWNAKRFMQCEDCGWRGEAEAPVIGCGACGSIELSDTRRRVFCASLADVFDNEVPREWRADLWALIRATPHIDWLLLTKRIGNWGKRLYEAKQHVDGTAHQARDLWLWTKAWLDGEPPANVWLGATICNQAEADRDIPKLLAVPARVRFLSIEPMLGPVDLNRFMVGDGHDAPHFRDGHIDWVICGGESGPQARPMHPDWVRSLRDQCAAAGVAFHFKQWGEWVEQDGDKPTRVFSMDSDIGQTLATTCDGFISLAGEFVRDMDDASTDDPYRGMQRVGTKAAGRLLDGIEHNAFPT